MKQMVLVLGALVIPGLWGAAVHWLLMRIWPAAARSARVESSSDAAGRVTELVDYQI